MRLERLNRHFLSFLLIGLLCYAGLAFFAQGGRFFAALLTFPLQYLPLLLALAFSNYSLRYFRWQVYLKALGIRLSQWRSFQIFMAGLTMSMTPGKAGEALKAHLLAREGKNPWTIGLSIVFVERLTDLAGLVVLVALGLKVLPFGRDAVLVGGAACLVLFLIFVHPTVLVTIVKALGKVPWMARRSKAVLEIHQTIKRLLTQRLVLEAVLISGVAWFAECWVLYFAVVACCGEASWLQSTFIYAVSTLAGALSILPGGLVATEGSMVALLLLFGLNRALGSTVTFIVRICTLWFAVLIGMFFLLSLQRQTNRAFRGERSKRSSLVPSIGSLHDKGCK